MLDSNRNYLLPHSGRRYSINPEGEVLNSDGCVLPSRIVDGQKMVRLVWLFGEMEYRVGTLVLLANGYFRDFPEYHLNEIEPLFKDANPHNTKIENLTYRFEKGPLEVEHFPGYFYIPFYTRYAISKDGVMITATSSATDNHYGTQRTWSIIPPNPMKGSVGGYRYLRANTDNGESRILFRHQALCWTFLEYGADVRDLVCNHLDGVPGNDSLLNLELTTHRENNLHAIRSGLRKSRSAIRMSNVRTGVSHLVYTIEECIEHAKELTRSMISYRLNNVVGKRRVYSDFWVFRRVSDTTPLPEYVEGVTKIYRQEINRALIAKDIHTGHEVIAASVSAMAKVLTLTEAPIASRLSDDTAKPYKGYCFKYLDDKRGWPSFSERQLKIHLKYRHKERTPDGVIATDSKTGEELFFCSRDEAAEYFNTTAGNVYSLATNEQFFQKRFAFKMFRVHENILWSH